MEAKTKCLPSGAQTGIFVAAFAVRQLDVLAGADIHDKNIEVALSDAAGPGKCKVLPVGMPCGIRRFALAIGHALHAHAISAHLVNLLMAGAGYEEQ